MSTSGLPGSLVAAMRAGMTMRVVAGSGAFMGLAVSRRGIFALSGATLRVAVAWGNN
jgi:hypothetical protein